MDDTDCPTLEGGGAALGDPPPARCGEGEGDSGSPTFDSDAGLEGGGCSHVGTAPLLAIVLVWLLRALFAFALVVPGAAFAIDAQIVDADDGGAWLGVAGGSSEPGTARVGLFVNHAANVVTLRVGDTRAPLIASVTTTSLAAAWDFGVVRVGFAVPEHLFVRGPGAVGPFVHGDRAAWLAVPLGRGLAWTVRWEQSANGIESFLGDPGSIVAALAGDERVGSFEVAFATRLRLQQPVQVVDVTWGTRVEGEAALGHAVVDGVAVAAIVRASAPWRTKPTWATLPLELDGAVRWTPAGGVVLHGLVGAGIGRGIGAPAYRVAAGVELHTLRPGDRDQDGRKDPIDACRDEPEDRDGFRDSDGCPDPDDDRDGFLDAVDACPREPEVVNGWRDEDGCPDELAHLVLRAADVERWLVAPLGEEAVARVGDDPFTTTRLPGRLVLDVEAPEHRPQQLILELHEGENEVTVALEPAWRARLAVKLTARGLPIAGDVSFAGTRAEVPVDGLVLDVPAGDLAVTASSACCSAARSLVHAEDDRTTDLVLDLEPLGVFVSRGAVIAEPSLAFAPDSAAPAPDGLDVLAAWLRAHPEVGVVRVEGHADSVLGSAYNLDLSERRARAVVEGLVARGIAPERLRAVGAGESTFGGAATRAVDVYVLVWNDPEPAPVPP